MIYDSYIPSPPLAEFVERFWQCSDTPSLRRVRVLPSGTIELVINLREDEIRTCDAQNPDNITRFSGAVVSGPYRGCLMVDPLKDATIIGVHFKPGGAFPFLSAPADELVDSHLDLEVLWGRTVAELRDRLCAATTADRRFSLLEETLVSRLRTAPERHGAVSRALATFDQTGGASQVHDVSRRLGLSQRRFIELFAAEVGLTPKLYCRIRRFQRVRELVRKVEAPDWTRVAFDCGYFDQSHLIRDFHAFSGFSPQSYLRQSRDHVLPNHIPQVE